MAHLPDIKHNGYFSLLDITYITTRIISYNMHNNMHIIIIWRGQVSSLFRKRGIKPMLLNVGPLSSKLAQHCLVD